MFLARGMHALVRLFVLTSLRAMHGMNMSQRLVIQRLRKLHASSDLRDLFSHERSIFRYIAYQESTK